jgi:hypothetical protein
LTRFSRSQHPRCMTAGAPSQYCNTGRFGSRQCNASPCEPVAMSSWLQQKPTSYIYEEHRLQSLTRTLHANANTTPSPNVTDWYNIQHNFNKLHLGEYSTILKLSCTNLHVHQTWVVEFAAQGEPPDESKLASDPPPSQLYLQFHPL